MSSKIDDLTMREIREIKSMCGASTTDENPYKVGANYFIRTVTHHLTGKLVRVTSKELVLVDAAWIADDGRFMRCLAEGQPKEVEPFPDGLEVLVGRGALIDAVEWKHKLPREQRL